MTDHVKRFLAYADAFEQACADDDWSRLEPYFTEDAVYKSDDPAVGFNAAGRAAILARFQHTMDKFDRRFDSRTIEMLSEPEARDHLVQSRWGVTYTLGGAPDLVVASTEIAAFEGDRMRLLVEDYDAGLAERVGAWMKAHGALLPDP